MPHLNQTSLQGSALGLIGSYLTDLRNWVGGIATGYVLGAAMLAAGVFSIGVAFGVGFAALFHWLEIRYGSYAAYGASGSLFLTVGVVGVVVGLGLLKRQTPPIPRPIQQTRALARAIKLPVIHSGNGARPDKLTQTLAGAAALALIGWIVTSYGRRSSVVDRETM